MDTDFYRSKSLQLRQFIETAQSVWKHSKQPIVEQSSIDDFYIDITAEVHAEVQIRLAGGGGRGGGGGGGGGGTGKGKGKGKAEALQAMSPTFIDIYGLYPKEAPQQQQQQSSSAPAAAAAVTGRIVKGNQPTPVTTSTPCTDEVDESSRSHRTHEPCTDPARFTLHESVAASIVEELRKDLEKRSVRVRMVVRC